MNLGELIKNKLTDLDDSRNQFSDLAGGKTIAQMKVDDQVTTPLKIVSKRIQNTKDGKSFLLLTLSDRTGTIRAIDWNNAKMNDERLVSGGVASFAGKVSLFDSRLQLNIGTSMDSVRVLKEGEFDPKKFIEITSKNVGEMYDKLIASINSVIDMHIRDMLKEIFINDQKLASRFIESPAASTVHHAYKGGLLEHSLDVMQMALNMADVYTNIPINRDLLVAGALLHDIGKVTEYRVTSAGIVRTSHGELIGHIISGTEILRDYASKITGFPQKTVMELEHIILSHHGEMEWGAPVLPKTIEALIIHGADNTDSKIAQFRELYEKTIDNSSVIDDEYYWSDYSKFLSRRIRVKGVNGNDDEKNGY